MSNLFKYDTNSFEGMNQDVSPIYILCETATTELSGCNLEAEIGWWWIFLLVSAL